MAFDKDLFASKLRRYREQFMLDTGDLSDITGIDSSRLVSLETAQVEPTGDEVLIFADVFKCDYRFFISSERVAPFEETEELFRRHNDELTREDRWAIQEFLYLCECEQYLRDELAYQPDAKFTFYPIGKIYKNHGIEAAMELRRALRLEPLSDTRDVFSLLRRTGLHVFRRKLRNSHISGLCVNHPTAGRCVLVNYVEDLYRQRFTAAHEACHAFLDANDDGFVVSFGEWGHESLREVRANTFAAHFLMPDELIMQIPCPGEFDDRRIIELAVRFHVNVFTLLLRLKDVGLINDEAVSRLRDGTKIPSKDKLDPELAGDLSPGQKRRKSELLQRGLSGYYVGLCIEAFDTEIITRGRLSEMLMCDEGELLEIAGLFGRKRL